MSNLDVAALIVGGGGAGLTASMLLSKLGVESLTRSLCSGRRTDTYPRLRSWDQKLLARPALRRAVLEWRPGAEA